MYMYVHVLIPHNTQYSAYHGLTFFFDIKWTSSFFTCSAGEIYIKWLSGYYLSQVIVAYLAANSF